MRTFQFGRVKRLLEQGYGQTEIARMTGYQRQDISLVARAWGYRFRRGRRTAQQSRAMEALAGK